MGPDNGDAPYLRVFLDNNGDNVVDHDVIFSPSTQPGACASFTGPVDPLQDQCNDSGRTKLFEVHKGTVRYDDDAGNVPDSPWNSIINDNKNDVIMDILVSYGFSLPGGLAAELNSLSFELRGRGPRTFYFGQ